MSLQAYMIVDMFMFLLPYTPGDYLFVGHHIMTAAYMIMSLRINRGGLSCLILMVLGESTSLFQNSWLIARDLRNESKVSQQHLSIARTNASLRSLRWTSLSTQLLTGFKHQHLQADIRQQCHAAPTHC